MAVLNCCGLFYSNAEREASLYRFKRSQNRQPRPDHPLSTILSCAQVEHLDSLRDAHMLHSAFERRFQDKVFVNCDHNPSTLRESSDSFDGRQTLYDLAVVTRSQARVTVSALESNNLQILLDPIFGPKNQIDEIQFVSPSV